MNPIKLSHSLNDSLVGYLTATFDVNRDGRETALAAALERSFRRPQALFNGPFLELTPPYRTAASLEELADQGIIARELLTMDCFAANRPLPPSAPLYTHQDRAIRKLCQGNGRNVIISSGTGSGKTECFLLPILNDLIKDPTPGVRAILIYPMNALVNDQLDRLRILLKGTNITFGRYTSELETRAEDAREKMRQEWQVMDPGTQALYGSYPLPNEIVGRDQIREEGHLPQILITNYAMLEYLLLRPEDDPLFRSGAWRFLVLDEAHTYSGAQGVEVSLLIRRLKHRLRKEPGDLRCIATSATLTDDDARKARDFGTSLFGESFELDDVIFGEPDPTFFPDDHGQRKTDAHVFLHSRFPDLIAAVRDEDGMSTDEVALLMEEIGLIDADQLTLANARQPEEFLWETMKENKDIIDLRRHMTELGVPLSVTDAADWLFHERLSGREERQEALYHLVELASLARLDRDQPSLLPARYHLFARPPQGMWVCLNSDCTGKEHDTSAGWSRLFAARQEKCDACGAHTYPLRICRSCGQVYVRTQKQGRKHLAEADPLLDPSAHFFTWSSVEEQLALGEEADLDDEEMLLQQDSEAGFFQEKKSLCLCCQHEIRNGRCGCEADERQIPVELHLVVKSEKKRNGVRTRPVSLLNECLRCHSKSRPDTDIATEVSIGGTTPLSVITNELYRELPTARRASMREKAGGGRKLLTFYDSRQGAARFAAFLQDVVNQRTYLHIITVAISELERQFSYGEFGLLAERAMALALHHRVFHNDPLITERRLQREVQNLEQHVRERLLRPIRTRVLAEFTTGARARQSLEALGAVAVHYYPPQSPPDFAALGDELGLSADAVRAIVDRLLDTLRYSKVVKLPEDVNRDDRLFGRNAFSPLVVRGTPAKNQVSWSGKTARHRRRRLVQQALQKLGTPADDDTVEATLRIIWDWLTVPDRRIFDVSNPAAGFQIDYASLFFQTEFQRYRCRRCQRLTYREPLLGCTHINCSGELEPIDQAGTGYYHEIFSGDVIPMRAEEHTAQLEPRKAREYQNHFKEGTINVLSCSTTFEMGIDLGDLQAVVLSNVPPTVANYKQRAGRAGRRASGTAFILAWAAERPHDQTYFRSPGEIINGSVRIPYISVQNRLITQRHVNAVILSLFLRHRWQSGHRDLRQLRSFFDQQDLGEAHYSALAVWLDNHGEAVADLLSQFNTMVGEQPEQVKNWLRQFVQDLDDKVRKQYLEVIGYYNEYMGELSAKILTLVQENRGDAVSDLTNEVTRISNLSKRYKDRRLIDHLSDQGVLPSYSFPLHTVELRVPQSAGLRLQRDLRQAIREYAPGQEIVADKRIWRSVALDFFGKVPRTHAYRICRECNFLEWSETAGREIDNVEGPCEVCGTVPEGSARRPHRYIVPDGFRTAMKENAPAAGQYVEREPNLTRSALLPGQSVHLERVSELMDAGYDRDGRLLYVNEGFQGRGFPICMKCGFRLKRPGPCNAIYKGQKCDGQASDDGIHTLGFMQTTDTLHLKFYATQDVSTPGPDDRAFWLSLMYALLQGASRALQIERRDIDGVLFPRRDDVNWQQTIVLFDDVPGGAGHVKRIRDEIGSVIAAALEIVDCECDPATSCYRCLREYSNQWEHSLLERGRVEVFLRALFASTSRIDTDVKGAHAVVAAKPAVWLQEQLLAAKDEVWILAEDIVFEEEDTETWRWFDTLEKLLLRNVRVRLFVMADLTPRRNQPGTVFRAHLLQSMLARGLRLENTNKPLDWQILIDPTSDNPRAIRAQKGMIVLGPSLNRTDLQSTSHSQAVREIWHKTSDYRGSRVLSGQDLEQPGDTSVIDTADLRWPMFESDIFGHCFEKPVAALRVNDRYLYDRERIVDRLGAYVAMAAAQGRLQEVTVNTWPAGQGSLSRYSVEAQSQAISDLEKRHPTVSFRFIRAKQKTEHDRFVVIQYANGDKARILIGSGLDFIESDGRLRRTYIVIEDPYLA